MVPGDGAGEGRALGWRVEGFVGGGLPLLFGHGVVAHGHVAVVLFIVLLLPAVECEAVGFDGFDGVGVGGPGAGFDAVGVEDVEDVGEEQGASFAVVARSPVGFGDAVAFADNAGAVAIFEAQEESADDLVGRLVDDHPGGDVIGGDETLEFGLGFGYGFEDAVAGPGVHVGFEIHPEVGGGIGLGDGGSEADARAFEDGDGPGHGEAGHGWVVDH